MTDLTTLAANNWRTLADLLPALTACLEPRKRPGSGIHSKPASKPPINITTSDLLHEIDLAVDFYVSALLMEADIKRAPSELADRIRLVADNAEHFTTDTTQALVFSDEAEGFVEQARRIIDRPQPPAYMGPCLSACGGELRLKDGENVARCDSCGEYAPLAAARAQLLSAYETRLMTRDELHVALKTLGAKVTLDAIHKWVQRGRLVPVIDNRFRLSEAAVLAKVATGLAKTERVA